MHPSLRRVRPRLLLAMKPTLSSWPRAPAAGVQSVVHCVPTLSSSLRAILFGVCRHLPLARDLVRVARQRLVFRLDAYCKRDNKLFSDVIK